MSESRSEDNWARTSSIMSLIANCHRDPKKGRAFKPSDFTPFAKKEKPIKGNVGMLRDVFVPKKNG